MAKKEKKTETKQTKTKKPKKKAASKAEEKSASKATRKTKKDKKTKKSAVSKGRNKSGKKPAGKGAKESKESKNTKEKKVVKAGKKDKKTEKKKPAAAKKSKKSKRNAVKGRVYIQSTFNNTVVTVTDSTGEVLSWSSGGVVGNKGSRKSTPYAAAQASKDAIEKAKKYGLKEVDVHVSGLGPGKETAFKALGGTGVKVLTVRDAIKFPHNGCRPRKRKR